MNPHTSFPKKNFKNIYYRTKQMVCGAIWVIGLIVILIFWLQPKMCCSAGTYAAASSGFNVQTEAQQKLVSLDKISPNVDAMLQQPRHKQGLKKMLEHLGLNNADLQAHEQLMNEGKGGSKEATKLRISCFKRTQQVLRWLGEMRHSADLEPTLGATEKQKVRVQLDEVVKLLNAELQQLDKLGRQAQKQGAQQKQRGGANLHAGSTGLMNTKSNPQLQGQAKANTFAGAGTMRGTQFQQDLAHDTTAGFAVGRLGPNPNLMTKNAAGHVYNAGAIGSAKEGIKGQLAPSMGVGATGFALTPGDVRGTSSQKVKANFGQMGGPMGGVGNSHSPLGMGGGYGGQYGGPGQQQQQPLGMMGAGPQYGQNQEGPPMMQGSALQPMGGMRGQQQYGGGMPQQQGQFMQMGGQQGMQQNMPQQQQQFGGMPQGNFIEESSTEQVAPEQQPMQQQQAASGQQAPEQQAEQQEQNIGGTSFLNIKSDIAGGSPYEMLVAPEVKGA